MTLLMVLLSVLAATLLLSVLMFGLLLIVKPLQSVRGYLEQIAMGVRAIERQVAAFPGAAGELTEDLDPLGGELQRAGSRLEEAAASLERGSRERAGGSSPGGRTRTGG